MPESLGRESQKLGRILAADKWPVPDQSCREEPSQWIMAEKGKMTKSKSNRAGHIMLARGQCIEASL